MISLDLAGRLVERHDRAGIEIVAGPLVAHPWAAIAGAPERQVGLRIEHAGDPHGTAAGLPLIALRPRLAAGLAGCGDGVGAPQFLAGVGIECHDEAAHAEFAAGRADQNLAVDHQRRQRHVVALRVVLDLRAPHLLAGSRVERDKHRIGRGEEHLVAPQPDAAAGRVQLQHVLGDRPLETPQQIAGLGVDRQHLIARRGDEHDAVVDDGRCLMPFQLPGRHAPHRVQVRRVRCGDLAQRTVAPAVVGAAEHQPVAIIRLLQSIGRDRLVGRKCRREWQGRGNRIAIRRHGVRRGGRCRGRIWRRLLGERGRAEQSKRERGTCRDTPHSVSIEHRFPPLLLFDTSTRHGQT